MKKLIVFVLALICVLAMAGCGQNQTNRNSVLGSWETETEVSILGDYLSDEIETQRVNAIYCFEFYQDGTGKSSVTFDGKYAEHFPDTNVSFTYMLDGDQLALTYEDGNTQKFTVSFSDENLILDGRARIELLPKK